MKYTLFPLGKYRSDPKWPLLNAVPFTLFLSGSVYRTASPPVTFVPYFRF